MQMVNQLLMSNMESRMISAGIDGGIDLEDHSSESPEPLQNTSVHSSNWYERKTLVKEVFYVQSILVFIVVIASIVNIARDISECDKQVWLLLLSSGIAHMLPCPNIGKGGVNKEPRFFNGTDSESRSSSRKTNIAAVWFKRTSQHREIFYVQAVLIFVVVLSCIAFLSADIGEKNILIVLLSASFAHFLPGPSFIQSKVIVQ